MALDLTADTVEMAPEVARADPVACGYQRCPHPPWWNHRLCDRCNLRDHQLCCRVACYGCAPENHPRYPGVSGLGQGAEHGAPGARGRRR